MFPRCFLKGGNLFWRFALFRVCVCLSASLELLKKNFTPASQWELEDAGCAWVSICQVQVVCSHHQVERAVWDCWAPYLSLGEPGSGRPDGTTYMSALRFVRTALGAFWLQEQLYERWRWKCTCKALAQRGISGTTEILLFIVGTATWMCRET